MRIAILTLLVALSSFGRASSQELYSADVEFALRELPKLCGHFFKLKKIDWDAVSKEFRVAAQKVKDPSDHMLLMQRLLARLKDGHARIYPGPKGKGVRPPAEPPEGGLGLILVRSKKHILAKSAWGPAKEANIAPGARIEKVAGKPVDKWLAGLSAKYADRYSFSTQHHLDFFTLSWGISGPVGERVEIQFRDPKGKKRKRTLTYDAKTKQRPEGPARYADDAERHGDIFFWRIGKKKKAIGYLTIRKSKRDLPGAMDKVLADLGDVAGLILDFRGNTGGSFDHDALMGRFIPKGMGMRGQTVKGRVYKRYKAAGDASYAGPIVVIVNATTVSAGETASGMFKEDGRGYMIGESPTAGMSSSKKRVKLPSGLFELRVSVSSNKGRFNDGRGIEGIGVIPHETIVYDAKDLAAGKDTLIERAVKILKRFPKKKVPFEKRFE